MKIFDCFVFFNEVDQLRLRLDYLQDSVDAFVVVEANQTFSGIPKPLFLSESLSQALIRHPKVKRVVVDFPPGLDAWGREAYQRDAIRRGLKELEAQEDDFFLVSDVDEIPSVDAIASARSGLIDSSIDTIAIFEQRLFYFRLNYELVWSRKLPWLGTVMARVGTAASSNGLRMTGRRVKGRNSRGFNSKLKVLHVPEGGWHFSYLGDDAALDAKLSAYSHQEHNTPAYRKRSVRSLIDSRQGLHERGDLKQVWAVIPPDQMGIDAKKFYALGLEALLEPNPDSIQSVVSRIADYSSETRVRIGPLNIGLQPKK